MRLWWTRMSLLTDMQAAGPTICVCVCVYESELMMVVPLLSQWSLLCPWMRPEDGRVYAQEAVVNFSKAWCSQLIFLCACGFYFFTFLVYSFIFSCCYFALVKKTHPVNYTVFYLFIFFFSLQLSLITFHTWVQVASARVAQGPQTHRPHSIQRVRSVACHTDTTKFIQLCSLIAPWRCQDLWRINTLS